MSQAAIDRILDPKVSAADAIAGLQTAEQCADFYVSRLAAFSAVMEVWKHVRAVLMLEGKSRSFRAGGGRVVCIEPSRYEYDLESIKAVAPQAIKDEPVPQSEEMEQINMLAQEMFTEASKAGDAASFGSAWVSNYAEEFLRLSQPKTIEKVDGKKLAGILGRGDQQAQDLANKQVKVPVDWKIVVK